MSDTRRNAPTEERVSDGDLDSAAPASIEARLDARSAHSLNPIDSDMREYVKGTGAAWIGITDTPSRAFATYVRRLVKVGVRRPPLLSATPSPDLPPETSPPAKTREELDARYTRPAITYDQITGRRLEEPT